MSLTKSSAALDEVPLKMLRHRGETALKNLQEQKQAHGRVLRRAAQLAGYDSDKELGVALGDVSASQLSAWFSGAENAQTWRFEQHAILGPALTLAQAESHGFEMETRFVIPRRLA